MLYRNKINKNEYPLTDYDVLSIAALDGPCLNTF